MVEPGFTVTKVANPTTGGAGDDITFTITVTSSNAANTATAFEVELSDVAPLACRPPERGPLLRPGADRRAVPATQRLHGELGLVPGGHVVHVHRGWHARRRRFRSGADQHRVARVHQPAGQRLQHAVAPQRARGRAHRRHLAGGRDGERLSRVGPGERHGQSGGADQDDLSANLAETTGNNVAVGERITYKVVVQVPEGVNTAVQLVDTLDPGLALLRPRRRVPSSGDLSTSVGSFATVLVQRAGRAGITNGAADA